MGWSGTGFVVRFDGTGASVRMDDAAHYWTLVVDGTVQPRFDTQGGDGFLLSLDPATGSYDWGSFYYGGKGAEELEADFVTGLVSTSSGLYALHQNTPGPNNHAHFWGRWYQANDDTLDFPGGDGSMRLADYELTTFSNGAKSVWAHASIDGHPAESQQSGGGSL